MSAQSWEFIRELGSGGHGRTSLVKRSGDNSFYVMKKLLLENDTPERRVRLQREAEALRKLGKHPGIAEIVDDSTLELNDANDDFYIVTEFIAGKTLDKVMDEGPFSVAAAVELTTKLLVALEFCHENDVIHRDIKPENIMVRENGNPVLLDFGLSFSLETAHTVSKMGERMGNGFLEISQLRLAELPPEQKRDKRFDLQYIIGILFYVLTEVQPQYSVLLGQKPHERLQPRAILESRFDEDVRAKLYGFFSKGFVEQMDEGFQSAREMQTALYLLTSDFIPGLDFSKVALEKMGTQIVSGSEGVPPLKVMIVRGDAHPDSPVEQSNWFFQIHIYIQNNEMRDVRDYRLDIEFPIGLAKVTPLPLAIHHDRNAQVATLRCPPHNNRITLKANSETRLLDIDCALRPAMLDDRSSVNDREIVLRLFRQEKQISEEKIKVERLDVFAIMDGPLIS